MLEEKRVEEGSSEEGEEEVGGDVFDKLLRPDIRIHDGRPSLNLGLIFRSEEVEWGTEEDGEEEESEDEDEDTELSESSESRMNEISFLFVIWFEFVCIKWDLLDPVKTC